MKPITTILFDCGGVLTPDPYETILLHDQRGIGRHLGLGEPELVATVRDVWDRYAILPRSISRDFWDDMGRALGLAIDHDEIERVKQELVVVNDDAVATLRSLRAGGTRIGTMTNNTAFFYAYQAQMLQFGSCLDPEIEFVSSSAGVTKSNGLFELAATRVDPAATLVIDDRQDNIERANRLGFSAVRYSMSEDGPLLAGVQRALV